MRVNFQIIKETALEKCFILQEISMKDNGKMIKNRVRVLWIGLIPMKNIQDNGCKICLMVTVNIFGIKIKLNAKHLKIFIKVTGKKERGMGLELFSILMDVDLRDILNKILNKD